MSFTWQLDTRMALNQPWAVAKNTGKPSKQQAARVRVRAGSENCTHISVGTHTCVYTHVCRHVRARVHICACTLYRCDTRAQTSVCTHMHVSRRTHISACVQHQRVYDRVFTCRHMCVVVCAHGCMHTCMCVSTCVWYGMYTVLMSTKI